MNAQVLVAISLDLDLNSGRSEFKFCLFALQLFEFEQVVQLCENYMKCQTDLQ